VSFRRSLVGGVGYCALDRRREPLTGEEQRGCWSALPAVAGDGLFVSAPAARGRADERGLIDLTGS